MAAYDQVSQLNPAYPKPHNNRANVARIMAEHLAARSRDPSRWIEHGRLAVEAALEIHPDYSLAWFNLGALNLIEARYLESVGISAAVSAQQAMEAFSRGLEANESILDAWLEYVEAARMVATSPGLLSRQGRVVVWQCLNSVQGLLQGCDTCDLRCSLQTINY